MVLWESVGDGILMDEWVMGRSYCGQELLEKGGRRWEFYDGSVGGWRGSAGRICCFPAVER